jgi:hypothetical protein
LELTDTPGTSPKYVVGGNFSRSGWDDATATLVQRRLRRPMSQPRCALWRRPVGAAMIAESMRRSRALTIAQAALLPTTLLDIHR